VAVEWTGLLDDEFDIWDLSSLKQEYDIDWDGGLEVNKDRAVVVPEGCTLNKFELLDLLDGGPKHWQEWDRKCPGVFDVCLMCFELQCQYCSSHVCTQHNYLYCSTLDQSHKTSLISATNYLYAAQNTPSAVIRKPNKKHTKSTIILNYHHSCKVYCLRLNRCRSIAGVLEREGMIGKYALIQPKRCAMAIYGRMIVRSTVMKGL
jgi:hypothetical protein